MTIEEIRQFFPVLERKIYGKNLVYFDNAATSQRPQSVIDCWNNISLHSNANIHRAVHILAQETTEAYESARDAVNDFINSSSREQIIFTSGTTAGINLVAYSFGEAFVNEGDEIIISEEEHHSNILPWQLLCKRKGAVLKIIPVKDDFTLDLDVYESLLSDRTRIVAVSHISNVLGIVNPVKEIIELAHRRNIPVLIDGAQGIVHESVDVTDLDCDFYAFSGHKLFAATGTGVLYAKSAWLDRMPPFLSGGEMVGTAGLFESSYAPNPYKWEAGTQNFASSATLKPAIELCNLLKDNQLQQKIRENSEYMENALKNISGLHIFGTSSNYCRKAPVFSFTIEGVHHEDLAILLDKMGVAVRSGQMCAEPLMNRFGVTGMVRASLAPYNTREEIEYFVMALKKAKDMLL